MPEIDPQSEPLTLAGLRRRTSARKHAAAQQPDLFSLLDDTVPVETQGDAAPTIPENDPATELPAARASTQKALLEIVPDRSLPEPFPAHGPAKIGGPAELAVVEQERAHTWTVTDLVRHVRGLVERGYGRVTVEGEVSNWRPAGSGHCYFTVKDAGAQLTAVMFRRQVALLRFRPADGDAVRLHGQLSLYESRGQMQMVVEWMQQVGFGALLAEVQQLKERLRREGLFDRKRPMPPFPRCIGVITSLQGAALRDIVKVCRRRHAAVRLLIYPAAVQGPNCAGEITAGLRWFNAHPDQAEVVLVARGGGSWEDLHGFDHETVVRAIAGSLLPVMTGIGHATDSVVADAAADQCAPTPSAAAELLTAAQHQVEERVARLYSRLLRAASFELLRAQQRWGRLGATTVLRQVEDGLDRRAQHVDELLFRVAGGARGRLLQAAERHHQGQARLQREDPSRRVAEVRRRLGDLALRLHYAGQQAGTTATQQWTRGATRLEAMSPLRVLERGYALVYAQDGSLLRSAEQAVGGQLITARLGHGSIEAQVLPFQELSSDSA